MIRVARTAIKAPPIALILGAVLVTNFLISHRTVGSHLYRIFPKLGVSSRVEVARAVERAQRETGDVPG